MLGCCHQFYLGRDSKLSLRSKRNSYKDRREINTAPTVITPMSKVLILHKITVANQAICTSIKSHNFTCEFLPSKDNGTELLPFQLKLSSYV